MPHNMLTFPPLRERERGGKANKGPILTRGWGFFQKNPYFSLLEIRKGKEIIDKSGKNSRLYMRRNDYLVLTVNEEKKH